MKKGLLALASGTFALGMAEFGMMGILPDAAMGFNVSIPAAGYFIAAYALGVCSGAPLLVLIARKRPLKQILFALSLLIIIGNLLTASAQIYPMMIVSRFLSGLPHGAFFGVGSIVAEKLADNGKSAQAIAIMTAGMTIANLIGIPIGTYISHHFSWRLIFLAIACCGGILFLLIKQWIPDISPLQDTGLLGQFRFFKKPAPWLVLIATILGNGGIFCWFSYISPLLTEVSGFSPDHLLFLMALAGLGMFFGNLTGGKLSDQFGPGLTAAVAQGIMCFALIGIFLFANNPVLSILLMVTCTFGLFSLSSPQQLLLIKHAKGGEMLGAACVQIAFNLGNATGAWLGGVPISAGYNYNYTTLPAIVMTAAGCTALMLFWRKYEKVK